MEALGAVYLVGLFIGLFAFSVDEGRERNTISGVAIALALIWPISAPMAIGHEIGNSLRKKG